MFVCLTSGVDLTFLRQCIFVFDFGDAIEYMQLSYTLIRSTDQPYFEYECKSDLQINCPVGSDIPPMSKQVWVSTGQTLEFRIQLLASLMQFGSEWVRVPLIGCNNFEFLQI